MDKAKPDKKRCINHYRRTTSADLPIRRFLISETRTALHEAAKEGSVEEMKSLLDQGCEELDSRSRVDDYRTALHLAVLSGSEPKVRLLLDRGASINFKDIKGNNALHLAFFMKNTGLIELLLEKGADVFSYDENDNTPMHNTVLNKFESGFQILLAAGVNPSIKNHSGSTALHTAVYTHSALNTLLAAGCDPNIKRRDGRTPLHSAVQINYISGVKTLLAAGVDPNIKNNQGQTPLIEILGYGSSMSIDGRTLMAELLAWGTTMEIEDEDSGTPFPAFSVYPEATIPFSEHLTKLKCANLNMDIEKQDYQVQDCSVSFQASGFQELEKMKANRFGRFSLYDIFAKYNDPLYCLSEELEEATKPNYSALDSEFPLYAPLLRARFFKAKQRLLLLHEAQSRVPFNVPEEIKRKILSFVDSKNLGNVVKAFGGAN